MKCLIIKQPWIELILSGKKTWEMRSRPTNIRGRIGLIEQGTGLIVGEVDIVDSFHAAVEFYCEKAKSFCYHRIDTDDFDLLDKYEYAWVLDNVKRYEKPIPYKHPQGAVVWVNVEV
jgi:predicted transcriptional regulator